MDTIILTNALLEAARTPRGGYTAAQMELMGTKWGKPGRWKKSLIGKRVPRELYDKFVSLGGRVKFTHPCA